MSGMYFQITGHSIVCLTACADPHQRNIKVRIIGHFVMMTGEFPAQMASNAENVSIWCRHHESIASMVKQYSVWLDTQC